MHVSIRTELEYDLPQTEPVDLLLQIEAAIIPEQRVIAAHIDLPMVEHFARVPAQACIGERIWLRLAGTLKVRYAATVSVERLIVPVDELLAVPPHQLPGEAVDYLLPSRFCPSDLFTSFVEDTFGGTQGGQRIAAIRNWIARTMSYEPGSSNAATTAVDTLNSCKGVCRDYAHLLSALARASTIPARYASVYGLGVEPQDFHAVPEVFLDGAWHLVDATQMTTPGQIAKIGVGRDAADASFLTCFGPAELVSQSVCVERG